MSVSATRGGSRHEKPAVLTSTTSRRRAALPHEEPLPFAYVSVII